MYLANLALIEESGYENAKTAYGSMKLMVMQEDGLVFVLSKTAYSLKKGIDEALPAFTEDDYDLEYPVILSRSEAQQLYDKGIIYEIMRPVSF